MNATVAVDAVVGRTEASRRSDVPVRRSPEEWDALLFPSLRRFPCSLADMTSEAGIYPGDHLRVRRGLYFHHGVVVPARAEDRAARRRRDRLKRAAAARGLTSGLYDEWPVEIVHYVKDAGPKGTLGRTGIEAFLNGSDECELMLPPTKLLPPEETVHRALAHVGHGEYFVVDHNCEHFFSWCSTGHWRSGQVEAVATFLFRVGA